MTTETATKTFDVNEIFPETTAIVVSKPSIWQFLLRAFLAAILVSVALVGALLGAKALNLLPSQSVVSGVPVTSTTGGAGIERVISNKWLEIEGPNGVKLYTQCDSLKSGTRVFLTSTGQMSTRDDLSCK